MMRHRCRHPSNANIGCNDFLGVFSAPFTSGHVLVNVVFVVCVSDKDTYYLTIIGRTSKLQEGPTGF